MSADHRAKELFIMGYSTLSFLCNPILQIMQIKNCSLYLYCNNFIELGN